MVASLNQSTPAREAGYQMSQYIAGRLTLNGIADNAKVKIGTLPAGSIITAIHSKVATAITGGTPVLGLGTTNALVGTTGNIQNVFAETAGSELVQPLAALVMPLAADTDVWAGTSGGATAGDAYITVAFVKPLS
jgi:hypothetical protein